MFLNYLPREMVEVVGLTMIFSFLVITSINFGFIFFTIAI